MGCLISCFKHFGCISRYGSSYEHPSTFEQWRDDQRARRFAADYAGVIRNKTHEDLSETDATYRTHLM